jgi:hypothetical protein
MGTESSNARRTGCDLALRWRASEWRRKLISIVATLAAQQRARPQDFKQAAAAAPQLAEVLDIKPGMVVADVGAGFSGTFHRLRASDRFQGNVPSSV